MRADGRQFSLGAAHQFRNERTNDHAPKKAFLQPLVDAQLDFAARTVVMNILQTVDTARNQAASTPAEQGEAERGEVCHATDFVRNVRHDLLMTIGALYR